MNLLVFNHRGSLDVKWNGCNNLLGVSSRDSKPFLGSPFSSTSKMRCHKGFDH